MISLLKICPIILLAAVSDATTPMTTPPTTPPPPPAMLTKYGASKHRQDKMLDVAPFKMVKGVSRPQCLGLCLQQQTGKIICKAFNYGNRTCFLLDTYVCDGDRTLLNAPGFSYFDIMDNTEDDVEFVQSQQCETKGKCSNKCRKYKLIKTPLSWHDAQATCRDEQAHLAMPKTMKDHITIINMMKKANILQSWVGLRKKDGVFYYTDKTPMEDFNMWGPDQPNDSGGTQECVEVMADMDYMWNDFDCQRAVGFICQYVW